jgi:endoglucanase
VTEVPPLLAELLLAHGASGYEDAVQAIVRREAAAIGAGVETDVLGSTVATIGGTAGGRTLALFAHADQIGMAVRDAGQDGLLAVGQVSGWASAAAARQRVRIATSAGEIRGVVVPPDGEMTWEGLRVDIGARDREHAFELVRPGDPIVLDGPPEPLASGRVLSAALDDRVGIWAGLELLRRVAADRPAWTSCSSSPDRRRRAATPARASSPNGSVPTSRSSSR